MNLRVCAKLANPPSLCHKSSGLWSGCCLKSLGSSHSDPFPLGSPWALASRGWCWMAFAYWGPGLRSLAKFNWGRAGFSHLLRDTWTTHTHNTLQISPRGRALVPSLYIPLPLCLSDFLSLLLPWKNDFQLCWKFPLSHQSAASPVRPSVRPHIAMNEGTLHRKAQTMLVSVWARFKSWHQTPPSIDSLFATTNSLFLPSQSLKLLISFTLAIFIKILYLEKKVDAVCCSKISWFDGQFQIIYIFTWNKILPYNEYISDGETLKTSPWEKLISDKWRCCLPLIIMLSNNSNNNKVIIMTTIIHCILTICQSDR